MQTVISINHGFSILISVICYIKQNRLKVSAHAIFYIVRSSLVVLLPVRLYRVACFSRLGVQRAIFINADLLRHLIRLGRWLYAAQLLRRRDRQRIGAALCLARHHVAVIADDQRLARVLRTLILVQLRVQRLDSLGVAVWHGVALLAAGRGAGAYRQQPRGPGGVDIAREQAHMHRPRHRKSRECAGVAGEQHPFIGAVLVVDLHRPVLKLGPLLVQLPHHGVIAVVANHIVWPGDQLRHLVRDLDHDRLDHVAPSIQLTLLMIHSLS